MDRLIEVKVSGNYLRKDTNRAGVQGEANVTTLRIAFDESWDGYTKTLTWWDACGENPVVIELLPNLLEDAADSTRIYRCLIPAEPLAVAGWCSFVIDGYIDGKRQRTVEDKLQVRYAPSAEGAGTPAEITPEVAEQLGLAIEALTGDIQLAAQVARSVERMTASAETGEPGSNATVEKSIGEDGGLIFTFRIPRGAQGEQGIPGKDGKDGADGQDGAPFTYDMFTAEQLEALRGPQGIQGIQGPIGQTGEPGPQGVQGEKGDKGDKGDKGEPGEDGTNGKDGETGPAGADGKDGAQGQRGTGILKVTTAPKTYNITSGNGHYSSFGLYLSDVLNQSGATEVLKGDIILYQDRLYTVYSVGSLGNISFVHTSSSYVSLRGADGETGPAGADGAPGADGVSIQGVSFYPSNEDGGENEVGLEFSDGSYWSFPIRNGSKGSTGETGATGPQGEVGPQGPAGAAGKDGTTPHIGSNGNWYIGTTDTGIAATGPKGDTGETGPRGPAGADGTPGQDGAAGKDGTTPHIGSNGNWYIGTTDTGIAATGPAGAAGKDGDDGAPGKDGEDGKDGFSIYAYSMDMGLSPGGDAPEGGTYEISKVVSLEGRVLQKGDLLVDITGSVGRVTGVYGVYSDLFDADYVTNIHGATGQQGPAGADGAAGKDGVDGQRGTGILKVTTAPASYTTAIGDYTPKYRIALSTVKTQSGVDEVLIGDVIQYSYYQYLIDYLDASYAYISMTRTSIRGATGAAGAAGADGATAAEVIAAMTKETWTFTLEDGTTVQKVVPLV